ncbi:phage holin family protein [Microbacterium sp. HD4P20]|uniref:phage holin family protein n=1 Tax=Microbacterium sp. HD4P20 TaxID=2864874 RepID=UPI001C63D3E7|nr:phage holin family protein [Microbacterium sp. HD4P20]MCP2637391.1 phage holin family protein [Microbacterium sp. HD4P20]
MFAFLIHALTFIVSAALGLILADLLLEGFHIDWSDWWGFVLAVLIFALIQSVLAPLVSRLTRRHAPALLGGIGILSTFVSIVIVVLIPGAGIGISQPLAWIVAPLIVWIVTAVATWLVPPLFIKDDRRDRRRA